MNAHPRPPKPSTSPFQGLPHIPAMSTLQQRDQWVSWDYTWNESRQKWDKPPINPHTGGGASHSNPQTWSSYADAAARSTTRGLTGVGYVLTSDDNITGIDLDDCRNGETGELASWVQEILNFAETYAEVSPSGQGVRLFALGKAGKAFKFDPAGIEIYIAQRYLTVTGRHVNGTPVEIREAPGTLAALVSRVEDHKQEKRVDTDQSFAHPHAGKSYAQSESRSQTRGGEGDSFFKKVNTQALQSLDCWVPNLFGAAAVYQPNMRGYRISSIALSRDLEEDLSITPIGIKDWGVWDIGDPNDGRRSAIDLVIEYGKEHLPADAALWLCGRLGIDPAAIGWRGSGHRGNDEAKPGVGSPDVGEDGDEDTAQPRALPIIEVIAGELPSVVDQAEDAVLDSGRAIFVRAGQLVRPIKDKLPAAKGRTTTVAKLKPLCTDSALDMLGQTAIYQRFDARKGDWVRIDPTARIASMLLARDGDWRLPRIAGVITTPTLRPDGSLLSEAGYDPATRLYLENDDSLRLPAISPHPCRADAEAALALLAELVSEFPFIGSADRAVALSGIITAVIRGAMTIAPLHAIRAHTPGTGKSLLVDVASTIATGRPCPVIAAGKTEEETEKRLGALLRDAVPIVSLDNVNGELGGDILCQITERPLVRVRILGRSEAPEFECRATVFATGNNLVLVGDMVRRTLLCGLDAGLERPELRKFAHDPIVRALASRGDYVAAAITIARAYRTAGMPEVCATIGSYSEWSDAVRAPLIWLGEADPVASMETARDEDPELTLIREVFSYWRDHLVLDSPYTTNQIITRACERDPLSEFTLAEFRDVLLRVAGDGGTINSKRLGKWLSRISGRVVEGHRLTTKTDSSHGNRYWLSSLSRPRASA
jgi:hypothetical protein